MGTSRALLLTDWLPRSCVGARHFIAYPKLYLFPSKSVGMKGASPYAADIPHAFPRWSVGTSKTLPLSDWLPRS